MKIKQRKAAIINIVWIAIAVFLLYLGICVDIGIAFLLSLFYFGLSYALSGISSYGSGNPYRGMILSPQPNEIEYSTYKMEYERRKRKKYAMRVNWLMLSIGNIAFIILLILLLTSNL